MKGATTSCNVVIGGWDERGIANMSARSPLTLFIAVHGTGLMARNSVVVKCESKAARLLTACLCRPGVTFEKADIVDLMFGERADGGPERVELAVNRAIGAARIAGAALGIVVTTEWGRGVSARLTAA